MKCYELPSSKAAKTAVAWPISAAHSAFWLSTVIIPGMTVLEKTKKRKSWEIDEVYYHWDKQESCLIAVKKWHTRSKRKIRKVKAAGKRGKRELYDAMRERERERETERDREREREWEREKESEKERDRERGREREKERKRGNNRKRDKGKMFDMIWYDMTCD